MNDDVFPPDPPSDDLLAVSAALDGSATADELARIEASPQLAELLAELRSHQDAVRDVPAPAPARETSIAAALAVFDELQHPVTAPTTSPVHATNLVSIASRRRWYRMVTAAAAALVLVVAGVAAIGSLGGSSDDDSSADVAVSEKARTEVAGDSPAATDAPSPLAIEAGPTEAPAATDAGAMDATQTADTETAAPPAAGTPVPTIGSIGGSGEVTPAIADEAALASYAANAPVRDADPDAPADQCVAAGAEHLGTIVYQGTPAVVARDPGTGTVTASAIDGCAVLVTLPG